MKNLGLSRRAVLQSAAVAGVSMLATRVRAAPPRDVRWLAEIQQPPEKLPGDAPKLSELLVDDQGRRITRREAWNKRREELRQWWLGFLGQFPAQRKAAPKLSVVEEDQKESVIRQLVRYDVEPGIATEAYLLKPEKVSGKAPGIAVFHSTVN